MKINKKRGLFISLILILILSVFVAQSKTNFLDDASADVSSTTPTINVTKDNFSNYFTTLGTASFDSSTGIATLTANSEGQVGALTLNNKLSFDNSFSFSGGLNLGNNVNGADGMGFAFHQGNTFDIGFSGNGLGIAGLQNAIGFKVDTYTNGYGQPKGAEDDAKITRPSGADEYGGPADPITAPFGSFVTTSFQKILSDKNVLVSRWWPTFSDAKSLSKSGSSNDIDGQFHDFSISYDSTTRILTVTFKQTSGNILTWTKIIPKDYNTAAFTILGSTGSAFNEQKVRFDSFNYQESATVNLKYIDTKGNNLSQGEVSYPSGAYVNGTYTSDQINIPGYSFKQMDDGSISGTKSIDPNGTLTKSGDNGTIIYVYEPNNYSIGFNSNNGSGTMTDQSFQYDTAQNLKVNTFSRSGYTFTGWNTVVDGSGSSYKDEESVINLTTSQGAKITLYAQWTANDQSINFDANGGSTDQTTISGKTDSTVDLSKVKTATRDGYTFAGWYTAKSGGDKMPDSLKVPNGGVTYYAQWTANEHSKTNNNHENKNSQEKNEVKQVVVNLTKVVRNILPKTGEDVIETSGFVAIILATIMGGLIYTRRK